MKNKSQGKIPAKQPNAAQRILNLEQNVMSIKQSLEGLTSSVNQALSQLQENQNEKMGAVADEFSKLQKSLVDVRTRVDATIEATDTNDYVSKKMLDYSVNQLKQKVAKLVELEALTPDNDSEIGDRSFVVGSEIDKEGNEVNPRVQFAMPSMTEENQEKLKGKKVGDVVVFYEESDALDLQINEVYTIPEIEKNFEEPQSSDEGSGVAEEVAASEEPKDVDLEAPQA